MSGFTTPIYNEIRHTAIGGGFVVCFIDKEDFCTKARLDITNCGCFGIVVQSRAGLIIDIDTDSLSHVICSYGGLGPHRLDYAKHQAALDDLINILEGDYHYTRMLRLCNVDGGGPNAVSFYNTGGDLICRISYSNGQVCIRKSSGRYALYEKSSGETLSFTEFEAYLKQYREFIR